MFTLNKFSRFFSSSFCEGEANGVRMTVNLFSFFLSCKICVNFRKIGIEEQGLNRIFFTKNCGKIRQIYKFRTDMISDFFH